jgi:hypothetical protein
MPARNSRGSAASSFEHQGKEIISPNCSNPVEKCRRPPDVVRTTKARKRERQQQQITSRLRQHPLIKKGLTGRANSGQPPPW